MSRLTCSAPFALRLARQCLSEDRLVLLGKALRSFLQEQHPHLSFNESYFEAAFVECLRRCGWVVTQRPLSPPGMTCQSFSTHMFWIVQPPRPAMGAPCEIEADTTLRASLSLTFIVDFQFRELLTVARPLPAFQVPLCFGCCGRNSVGCDSEG